MRRTCPFLLGALLIALICLGGGLQHLDRLLAPATAWLAGWLPAGLAARQPTVSPLVLASRELAPVAALLCLVLGPLFHRWRWLSGGLLFVASFGAVLLGTAVANDAGTVLVAPGALLSAIGLALLIGTLTRLESAAKGRACAGRCRRRSPHAGSRGAQCRADPGLRQRRLHPLVQSGCRGAARHPPADLVGTSFGRLLDMASHDQPRLFRRSDGLVRALFARCRNGRRLHLQASLSTLEWRGDRLRVAVLHDVSEVRADQELLELIDDATGLCNHVLFYDRIDQAILGRRPWATTGGRVRHPPSAAQADRRDARSTVRR
jgi:hypothetical protein